MSPDSLRQLEQFCDTDPKPVLVDALVGVGLQQALREPMTTVLDFLRGLNLPTVAIDVPSGMSADTGALLGPTLRCEHTISFQTAKICHLVTPAALYCGQVHVVDIGMYREVIERIGTRTFWVGRGHVKRFLPVRPPDAHKGTFGHVLIVGGSRGKGGAPALATIAALRIGAGLATALIPGSAAASFHRRVLSGMSLPYGDAQVAQLNEVAALWAAPHLERKSAIAIGPGLENTPETQAFLAKFLPQIKVPCVLDADALNILAVRPQLWEAVPKPCVITPHPAEAARLLEVSTDQLQQRRMEMALRLAQRRGITVLLKGANPLLATPQGECYFFELKEPALATAGTGDVLTGMIAGLLAQGLTPRQAVLVAVTVQGEAAKLAYRRQDPASLTAALLLKYIGVALAQLQAQP